MKKTTILAFLFVVVFLSCNVPGVEVPQDKSPPGEVSSLRAYPEDSAVLLMWENPSDSDFAKSVVSYGPSGEDLNSTMEAYGIRLFIDGLRNDQSYDFLVQTVDSTGNISQGIEISSTPSIPPYDREVSNLSVEPAFESVTLRWQNPVDRDFDHCEIQVSSGQESYTFDGTVDSEGTLVNNLQNGTLYNFKVFAVNDQGRRSSGIEISSTPHDFDPPAEVSDLALIPGDGSVTLSWTDPRNEDFSHCEISYNSGAEEIAFTGTVDSSATLISNLQNYTSYTFKIRTVDFNGNSSDGKQIQGSPVDLTPCSEVSDLAAVEGEYEIELSWNPVDDSDFDHYLVYYGAERPDTLFSGTISHSSTLIEGLNVNQIYFFKVCTIDQAGNISDGIEISAATRDATPAGEVQNLQASAGDHFVVLSWDSPSDIDLDYFLIYYGIGTADQSFTGTVDPAGTTIEGLNNDEAYTFKVVTVDLTGNLSTGVSIVKTPVDLIPPAEAQSFQAVAGNEQITLSWTNPSSDDFSHCVLNMDSGSGYNQLSMPLDPNSTVVASLDYGISYSFKLQTVDHSGNTSTGITLSSATLDDIAPGIPVITADSSTENYSPTVSWTCPVDATGFKYRWDNSPWITVNDPAHLSYTTNEILSLGNHNFQVAAIDRAGNESEIAQKEISIVLNAPDGLSLDERAYDIIYLSWNDNSSYEDEYIVERDSGSGFQEIARVNNSFYSDETCQEATSYGYRVYAANAAGDSSAVSANGTSLAALDAPTGISYSVTPSGDILCTWNADPTAADKYVITCYGRWSGFGTYTNTYHVNGSVGSYTISTYTNRTYSVKVDTLKGYNRSISSMQSVSVPSMPETPSSFSAVDAAMDVGVMNVGWVDNCSFETNYFLYRMIVGEETEYQLIATLDPDTDSYRDTVVQGKTYKYMVYAENNGVRSNRVYSNEVYSPVLLSADYNWNIVNRPDGVRQVWYKIIVQNNMSYEIQMDQLGRPFESYASFNIYEDMSGSNPSSTFPQSHYIVLDRGSSSSYSRTYYIRAEGGDSEPNISLRMFQHVPFSIAYDGSYLNNGDNVDLGAYDEDQTHRIDFELHNNGYSTIYTENLDIRLSRNFSGYYSLDLSSLPVSLAPGASALCTFDLIFSPTEIGNQTVDLICGWQNESNIPDETKTFHLTALGNGLIPSAEFYVNGVLKNSGSGISFGTITLGNSNTVDITVRNAGNGVLELSPDLPSIGKFTYDNGEFPLSVSGFSESFTITYTPDQIGSDTQYFYLNTNDPSQERVEFVFTGTGTGSDIAVSSDTGSLNSGDQEDFGPTFIRSDYNSRSFTIVNNGDQPLSVDSITLSSTTDFNLDPITFSSIAVGDQQVITVNCSPTSTGSINTILTINSNDFDTPAFEIDLLCLSIDGTPIPTDGSWQYGELLSYSNSDYYYFNATFGTQYDIYWADTLNLPETLTADIKVSCQNSQLVDIHFTDWDDAYAAPRSYTAPSTRIIVLEVQTWSMQNSHCGTYAIRVEQR